MRSTSSLASTCAKALALGLLLSGCATAKRQSQAAARVRLGHAYITEGEPELAISTLREATRLDRRNVEAWHQLALAYMARGAYAEAEDAFQRALKLNDEDASINLNYAYMLQKLDRNPEAIERLETARGDLTYRKPAMVLNNLGFAYLEEGRVPEAVAALEEAVSRQSNFCAAWYNLGLAYSAADELAKGVDAMDKVHMMCPGEYPEATLKIGEMLIDMGRREEGAMYLDKVVKSWPGTPLSQQANARLAAEGMQ